MLVTSISSEPLSGVGSLQSTSQSQTLAAGATASGADSVQLSPTAQANAYQQQGLAANLIASLMGVTTQTVDGYLGITTVSTGGGGGTHTAGAHKAPAHSTQQGSANASSTNSKSTAKAKDH
jgi:hypothetical protein